MSVVVAIAGLAALILVHEAGHFFTALAVGMRPRRFYIFFPPALAKVTHRGIEYGIGAIPLGGYVKIPGMHRPAPSDVDIYFGPAISERPQLFAATSALRDRLGEGDFGGASAALSRLEQVAAETELGGRARRAVARGLAELRDGLGPDAYWRQKTWKRVAVIVAGPATNFVIAVALFAAVFSMGYLTQGTTILSIQKGEPAASSALRVGDEITAVDGMHVNGPDDLRAEIAGSNGKPLTFTVRRGRQTVQIGPIRPHVIGNAYRVGIALGKPVAAGTALRKSVGLTGSYATGVYHSFAHRFASQGRKQLTGPVGIVKASSEAYSAGTPSYLLVLGLISLSLALLNLLPLLPLDGGHILFSLIERVRGRAVGREVYERASAVGIAFVGVFFLIALSNDIGRLGG